MYHSDRPASKKGEADRMNSHLNYNYFEMGGFSLTIHLPCRWKNIIPLKTNEGVFYRLFYRLFFKKGGVAERLGISLACGQGN